jgi:hypothetical protein
MAAATVPLGQNKYFLNQLDTLLFEICEELQLPPYRYNQADERYHAVSEALEAEGSPLSPFRPRIYSQGSMRLGTTVRPIMGPHDLDFVCELSLPHTLVEPIKLLQALYPSCAENPAVQGGDVERGERSSPKLNSVSAAARCTGG